MKKLIILAAAVAMVASFTLTASAAEWNFYGSARIMTWSADEDKPSPTADDRNTTWDAQGNSRIGANVKVSDTMVGKFEYGTDVNLRVLYGEWNFGAGKLLAGQTYTPASSMFYSNQVYGQDNDLLDCGQQYIGRVPMLQLTFGTFKLAFVRPNTGGIPGDLDGTDQDVTFPKIEASYKLKMDNFFVDFAGGYQTLEQNDVDIDSYLLAVGGGANFGAAYVSANVYMAQNGASYGLIGLGSSTIGYNAATRKIVDNDTLGYLLVAGFKVSDALTIEAGYGAIEHELDAAGARADEAATYYVNASITLAPGVFVVPEVGVIDLKDNAAGADEKKTTYFGAKWQMNF
jgi:hypothetical protein